MAEPINVTQLTWAAVAPASVSAVVFDVALNSSGSPCCKRNVTRTTKRIMPTKIDSSHPVEIAPRWLAIMAR